MPRDLPIAARGQQLQSLIKGQVDPISGRTLSSELVLLSAPPDVRYLQKGLLAALQASYFNGRLVIGTGLRRDTRSDFTRASSPVCYPGSLGSVRAIAG